MQHRSTLSKKGKLPSISNRNTATTTNNKDNKNESDDPQGKSKRSKVVIMWRVFAAAALYVLSGSTQPLLMTLVKQSGLGDPTCQLYMLFYYLGPALASLSFIRIPSSFRRIDTTARPITSPSSPTRNALLKSAGIASIDIIAQAMNYTGSTFCGPTIFAIMYSSVTIWTALFSRMVLAQSLNGIQWSGVVVVFAGLCITAWDSAALGPQVWKGSKGEMCFTRITFISLVVVVSGVLLFAIGTDSGRKRSMVANGEGGGGDGSSSRNRKGYTPIGGDPTPS